MGDENMENFIWILFSRCWGMKRNRKRESVLEVKIYICKKMGGPQACLLRRKKVEMERFVDAGWFRQISGGIRYLESQEREANPYLGPLTSAEDKLFSAEWEVDIQMRMVHVYL